ncbi:MAG: hypothetical protein NT039_02875 [Candidatus Berkelbacteria bacterium]|nr:hypothetical protein [Candidatus Berkelbacteria bacterium]
MGEKTKSINSSDSKINLGVHKSTTIINMFIIALSYGYIYWINYHKIKSSPTQVQSGTVDWYSKAATIISILAFIIYTIMSFVYFNKTKQNEEENLKIKQWSFVFWCYYAIATILTVYFVKFY